MLLQQVVSPFNSIMLVPDEEECVSNNTEWFCPFHTFTVSLCVLFSDVSVFARRCQPS